MNPETTPSTLPVNFKTARALRRKLGASDLERLDVDCGNAASLHLDRVLHSRIIGQDDSVQLLTCAFSRLLADLRDPGRVDPRKAKLPPATQLPPRRKAKA